MVSVDSSNTKGKFLDKVAATAASIALIMGRQNRSPNTVFPLNASDFMNLLAKQRDMDELTNRYLQEHGRLDDDYLDAYFGRANTH
jgi:hypothetical protein